MINNKSILFVIPLLFLFIINLVSPSLKSYSVEPEYGYSGMVVSASEIASRVGIEILREGGNAVDAAVAVGFTLAVVYPAAGNIGGGGFMLIRTADDGEIYALDYRETAPAASSRDIYLKSDGTVDENAIRLGPLSSGVPGTVRGLADAHTRFGKLEWKKLIEPSIKLAEDGFPLTYRIARSMETSKSLFSNFSSSKAIFVSSNPNGWRMNDKLIQKDLANTLRRIAEYGPDDYYTGQTAERIVTAVLSAGGIMTKDDLKNYRAIWRQPLKYSYRGYEIFTMPPPCSGSVAMAQILGMISEYKIEEMGFASADYIHLLAESMKRAFRDRAVYMGDPDFVDIPLNKLVSNEYIKQLASSIDMKKAIPGDMLGSSSCMHRESTDTTHFTIVDRWGNVVSNTYTLNAGYGSKFVAGNTGILINNEMDDFSVKPGAMNMYDLIGSEANSIQPGKRMLSSMSPTIVVKNNKFFMALGSPGGPTIITAVLQTMINVLAFEMNIQEAVNAPRIHHQWIPDKLKLENFGFAPDVIRELRARGHMIESGDRMGDVNAIIYIESEKIYAGAADPRLEDRAIGY